MLPKAVDAVDQVPVECGEVTVTFRVHPIPAPEVDAIREQVRQPDGTIRTADLVVPICKAGTVDAYSSVESTPAELGDDDWIDFAGWPEAWQAPLFAHLWAISVDGAPDPKAPRRKSRR